jgi:predicted Rossmann-fold nucleotide-binding protein
MHVIICGGRHRHLTLEWYDWLDQIRADLEITTVYHGGAKGIDMDAQRWAHSRGLTVHACPADWERHGPAAGPIRNAEMLKKLSCERNGEAIAVIAFPGGRGTVDMVRKARQAGVTVLMPPQEGISV